VKAFYSDTFVLPLPEHHRFPMAKYRLLRERLVDEGVLDRRDLHVPEPATWDELRLVHDPEYVDAVATGTLPADAQRRIGFPWSPMMVERSRRSVGATIAAARDVMCRSAASLALHGVAANLAGGTHHAFPGHGEGFCVLNDVAIAIRVLQREGRITRAAVVDLDVHQGNGTAVVFAGDPDVFTFSMHGSGNYPFRKERSTLDVELDDGCEDVEYLEALETHLGPVLDAARPELVFYLGGADPFMHDRFGRLGLSMSGLGARDRLTFAAIRRRGIPLVVTMAGGYARRLEDVVTIQADMVSAALAAYG